MCVNFKKYECGEFTCMYEIDEKCKKAFAELTLEKVYEEESELMNEKIKSFNTIPWGF